MTPTTNTIRIECPHCHKFTTIYNVGGVYSGKCAHCKPGVRFSVIAMNIISHKGRGRGAKNKVKRKEAK